MVKATDALLPPSSKFEHQTLVISTGVIGQNGWRRRNQVHSDSQGCETHITLHPAYLLRFLSRQRFTVKTRSKPEINLERRFITKFVHSWGRILAASGSVPLLPSSSTGEPLIIDPTKVSVTFIPSDGTSPLPVLVNGEPEVVDEVRAKEIMTLEDFEISINLGMGHNPERVAKYWTCDFSYVSLLSYLMNFLMKSPQEYVQINGDYHS